MTHEPITAAAFCLACPASAFCMRRPVNPAPMAHQRGAAA
jgi:hypothetical protein